ncbi:MAG: hypothetical protein JWO69_947 [Thermoleophilia bacterium]|nr:hypothetical protein [Thermoleophilia bacterium]
MQAMSDEPATPDETATKATDRRRDHLRLVTATSMPPMAAPVLGDAAVVRPRTIGRLIAQTAMIADSAVQRRKLERDVRDRGGAERGIAGKLLGRFR